MIRIERVRLPDGMQAFARRNDDAVVVYVSAELAAAQRTAAIARALRAAPEAGWRSPRSPVLLPALAGGARLRLVPESRWTYRGVLAAVPVVAAALLVTLLLSGGGTPVPRATASAPRGQSRATSQRPRTGDRPAAARGAGQGPGHGTGSAAAAARAGSKTKAHGKSTGGGAPAAEGSGQPSPAPPGTNPGSPAPTGTPAPGPRPSAQPSPTPTPSSTGSCVTVLGVTICL